MNKVQTIRLRMNLANTCFYRTTLFFGLEIMDMRKMYGDAALDGRSTVKPKVKSGMVSMIEPISRHEAQLG